MSKVKYEADITIVGSGIAGALLSYKLAKQGYQVICIDAGPRIDRYDVLERFQKTPGRDFVRPFPAESHSPHPLNGDRYLIQKGKMPYYPSYLRVTGGTTWHWAGHSWRFLPEDFREKSLYGIGRDMPISYDDLEPFYQEAEEEMGVAGVSDPLDYYLAPRKKPYPMGPVPFSYLDHYINQKTSSVGINFKSAPSARNTVFRDGRPPCCGSNNCMPLCPVSAQYAAIHHIEKAERSFPKKLTFLSSSPVTKIGLDASGKAVNLLEFVDAQGQVQTVESQFFVLAGGAIEIPKLLLYSGVGNDNVGRYLMDHPALGSSFLADEDVYPGRGPMVISSFIDRQAGSFRSKHSGYRINLSNSINLDSIARDFINHGLMGQELTDALSFQGKRRVGFEFFFGQLPDKENRVCLSTQKDALGIPKPEIHYQVDSWTRDAYEPAMADAETIVKVSGLKDSFKRPSNLTYHSSSHIMGTTIMGTSPEDSVCNSDAQVFSANGDVIDNLYVASSGLLSCSGVNNVTLTIAALSLRLANHLSRRLA